ncbi:22282_t:CDS:2 [Entrophospora sp. SA101]|nr:2950_t:CDS:2 [Entrophospora sp. SA101]CAJ0748034.1 22282_t:CDS:2 [Entrophospora sp. SA101]CAJ0875484.1 9378_t:CDS:2 [Entrophospora sp. SA101]
MVKRKLKGKKVLFMALKIGKNREYASLMPGYLVEPGDVIVLEAKMRNNKLIQQQLQQNVKAPGFLKLDKEKLEITYSGYPSMAELEKEIEGINFASVVE